MEGSSRRNQRIWPPLPLSSIQMHATGIQIPSFIALLNYFHIKMTNIMATDKHTKPIALSCLCMHTQGKVRHMLKISVANHSLFASYSWGCYTIDLFIQVVARWSSNVY